MLGNLQKRFFTRSKDHFTKCGWTKAMIQDLFGFSIHTMIRTILLFLVAAALTVTAASGTNRKQSEADPILWKNGDIVFQQSVSPQCRAIQLATHSEWTHCGVVFIRNGQWVVAEAVEPVVFTPVDEFIARGKKGIVGVRRLSRTLSAEQERAMWSFISEQKGKHYDIGFHWSDAEMYCSELVWKAYRAAGTELTEPRPMRSFDLSSPLVKSVMKKRYGDNVPLDEPMVSPGDLYQSEHLIAPFVRN
jgi:hypothetical protein